MNPIVVREMRARWRGPRPFLLIGAYVLLLSGLWLFTLWIATQEQGYQAARLGRDLFSVLTVTQTGFWMVLPGLLTATAISWEREQGLLEGMQLTCLAPRQIVLGKLASGMTFVLLILLVTLPITAVNFLLGGFSGRQFFQATVLQCCTALTSALIGLACSARSRRSTTALGTTLSYLALWGIGFPLLLEIFSIFFFFGIWGRSGHITGTVMVFQFLRTLVITAHPITSGLYISTDLMRSGFFFTGDPSTAWLWSPALQMLSWVLLFWRTLRGVARPLREASWLRSDRVDSAEAILAVPIGRTGHRSPFITLPLFGLGRIGNPVLRRELTSRFRIRRPGRGMTILISLGILPAVLLYGLASAAIWGAADIASAVGYSLAVVSLLAGALACLVLSSTAITREKETGNWEALRLTALDPGSILSGKCLAIWGTVCIISVPAWLLLIFTVVAEVVLNHPSRHYYFAFLVNAAVVLTGTCWFCTLLGMWCSSLFKKSTMAITAAVIMALGIYALLPALLALANLNHKYHLADWLYYGWNPFWVMTDGLDYHRGETLLVHSVIAFMGGSVMGMLTYLRLRREQ